MKYTATAAAEDTSAAATEDTSVAAVEDTWVAAVEDTSAVAAEKMMKNAWSPARSCEEPNCPCLCPCLDGSVLELSSSPYLQLGAPLSLLSAINIIYTLKLFINLNHLRIGNYRV